MSRHSPDEQPTTVLQQPTAEQPGVTTVPATRRTRIWQRKVPSRIGRARTSTVTIGSLFVLLFALHAAVAPDPVEYTNIVDANTGQTIPVPRSLVPTAPAPTTTTPTTEAPASTRTSASTTAPSRSTTPRSSTATTPPEDQQEPTTTAPQTTRRQTSEEAPTTSRAPATSAAPATTAEQTSAAPTS
jgi:hypothetical protein